MVAFMVLSIFTQAVAFSVITFIPLFMVDRFGINEEAAGAFLAIIYSAGLWASPLGGYLSDRLGRVPVVLVVCLVSAPLIYVLNLVPYGFHGLCIGALLLVIGMAMYIRMPVSEAFIAGRAPERHRSTIFGVYYFASMEAGGLLAPVLGLLIDKFGFETSFTVSSAALLGVTLVCSVFLWGCRD